MDDGYRTIPKHGHNNPDKAAQFMEDVTRLINRFMDSLSGFNRYELQSCYELFIHDFHKLLVELDSNYFQNASPKLMLDLVDDKICKAFTARPRDDAPPVIEVRKSTNSIPQGHDVLTLMVHQKLHKASDDSGQKAVVKLFNSLQAHDNLSNVAGVIAHLREILDNEQFTFIMQRAVHPSSSFTYQETCVAQWMSNLRKTG